MSIRLLLARFTFFRAHFLISLFVLPAALGCTSVYAQHNVSRRYPAGKNVRVELKNISGTITVESWRKDEIKVSANMEAPKANFSPRLVGEGLVIDVMGDNRGRGDVGDVNFKIMVPVNSSVDLETKRGD
ncbi:MAG TPA: hypothetical protein VFH31_14930, partial [Pyrinomonadaceae bacterium]|nr:hypothetical protein [Pyrinomonadaceae bacterium]